MINLKVALSKDISEGLVNAQKAGDLPPLKKKPVVIIERPDQAERGDYASPVALSLTKEMKKPPLDIVTAIAKHMPKNEYVGKINGAEPGFINIIINPGWLTSRLDDIIERDLCTDTNIGNNRSVNIEFISANPTGPLTLGNIRTAFSVDTLANVMSCAGFNVTREYYLNDAGGQIQKLGESVLKRALKEQGIKKIEYGDDLYQGDYIKELAAIIAEQRKENSGYKFTVKDIEDQDLIKTLGQQAARLIITDIKTTIADDLKIRFDVWTSEQTLMDDGIVNKTLDKLRHRKVTYKKKGAEYLRKTKFGDSEDRVLVKSDGSYAYIAPDIAYHQSKFDRQFDEILTFVGPDHQGHAPKLLAALQALGNDTEHLHIISSQWMRITRRGRSVKLSKRSGNIVTPKQLIDEVGLDATRFFMISHSLTTHMEFDLDLAQERSERNPVYYIQYAYVRLQSILRKAKEEGIIDQIGDYIELANDSTLTHTTELNLMRQLFRFPEVITDITQTFEPQSLAYYAKDLAQAIHIFYRNVPVLTPDDSKLVFSRLQLVLAARKVLGRTLKLMGISRPDVM